MTAFPLTPLQEGMLFHHLLDPHGGVDILQLVCRCAEPLDAARLRRAWEHVVARHEMLRAAFRWEGFERPVHAVQAAVEPPLQFADWRGAGEAEREELCSALLRTERAAGFAMERAPLFRVTAAREGDDRWRLIWTLHHAMLDGAGFRIVLAELFAAYANGAVPEPPAVQFREHVRWLERQDAFAAEPFWRARLRGFAAPTPLPLAAAAGRAGEASGECERRLSAAATAALTALAREHGVSLNVMLQGAWAMLLARHADAQDVLFGVVRACRHSSVRGAETIAGPLMNTLPVCVPIDRDAPLLGWLGAIADGWAALRPHEHTPLPLVQGWSEVAAPLPLFETLVNFSPATVEASLRAADPSWQERTVRQLGRTNYALSLVAWGGSQMTLRLQYDGARYARASVTRLLEQLVQILERMPQRAAGRVGELELADARARASAAVPAGALAIPAAFAAHARQTPQAIALRDGTNQLSHGELAARVRRLAQHLRARGVAAGVPVALALERSIDGIVALLGVLWAGGAYVPLAVDAPAARWSRQFARCGARLALTSTALRTRLPEGVTALCLDDPAQSESGDELAEPCAVRAEDTAYVLFTSGSTGEPKGVAVTHGNLANYVAALHARLSLGPDAAAFGCVSTLSADLGNTSIFGALSSGGTLHLIGPDAAMDSQQFARYVRAHPLDVLKITPSHLRALLDGAGAEILPRRWLVLGGEASSPELVEQVLTAQRCRVLNHYGPTETTVGACTFEATVQTLEAARAQGARTVPIGRPLGGVCVAVVDARGASVPAGVPGELLIGGAGVARGYVNDASRTAERFVRWPELGRAYRTGDRVRWLPSGELEFLGRFDTQVKIRGYRVEPGEIEAALRAQRSVAAAAVVVRADRGEPELVAYVVAADGASEVEASARAHLARELPSYMQPARWVVVERLPLTANGKVDRAALPAPDARSSADDEAPVTPTEIALAQVWSSVLGCERVGRRSDFFALGGHSLAAIRVLGRIGRTFGVRLPLRTVFDAPTLAELAAAIDDERRLAPGAP